MDKLRFLPLMLSYLALPACGAKDGSPPGTNKTPVVDKSLPGQDATPAATGNANEQQSGASKSTPAAPAVTSGTIGKGQRVLGLFGGYLSCNNDANAPFKNSNMQRYLETIQAKLAASGAPKAKYIMSCFGLDVSRVKYSSSDKPDEVQEALLSDFFNAMDGLITASPDAAVHVVGHSYGGWLGMDFVKRPKVNLALASLTTIDPISKVQCTPALVINSVLGSPVNQGCISAPADFSTTDLDTINQRTQSWINYYQTDATILHSGELVGAENIKRKYAIGSVQSHIEIAEDPEVSKQIIELITKGF